ncbi:50S ribosomal protein L6 [Candidatus Gottesmanbacteria bacterium RIFCSPHIGHO2_02_FULL_39_11]|uniref:Large ribosomal subunit protein uL6 n=1 Tax=Candidatus Gottesmanbacteria bacterium RIFCSPHIGHO2_02_FULL_39_11 TaxID=1798382 RepID=A0A1F5ZXS1_9BACT|nr:MAG: 50S ribosomal protein L6 [Candidatus Gottesmanbacteria bacterium RIFCSPHIGHO2_02_FULL_39_11]
MSRLGKKPLTIPSGTTAAISGQTVLVKGPKGEMSVDFPAMVRIRLENNALRIEQIEEGKSNLQGLYRKLIENALIGVGKEWTKQLELVGVGYKAQVAGANLILSLGYSHPVNVTAPTGIKFTVSDNKIGIAGVDKHIVGEIAARIRKLKPPEPYKGKGIKYTGEVIRKKLGKAAKAVGGAATGAK